MWIASARPDSYEPCESEIGLTVAQVYEAGDAIDTHNSALRCTDLDSFLLASLRTPAD